MTDTETVYLGNAEAAPRDITHIRLPNALLGLNAGWALPPLVKFDGVCFRDPASFTVQELIDAFASWPYTRSASSQLEQFLFRRALSVIFNKAVAANKVEPFKLRAPANA